MVSNEEVAGDVQSNPGRDPQLGAGRQTVVAVESKDTAAGDGGDDPGARLDSADAIVVGVSDIEVTGRVNGDTGRGPQLSAGRRAAVAAEVRDAGAGDRGDGPRVGRDPADAKVVGVCDEEGARGVNGDPGRSRQLGVCRRAIVAAEPKAPLPATVVMIPVPASTRRTRLLLASAI